MVLAITKDNVDAPPTLFRTYDSSTAFETSTIWQVARATSAATTFFKSIKVGRDCIEFADAGFGYNNPCDILTQEAQREFPRRATMRILSIGTGLGDVVTIKDKRLSIITALKKMATSSKKVAANMDHRYGDSGEYYRFNVDYGLQDITLSDWEKASEISAHTRNYLAENDRKINKFIDDFFPCTCSPSGNAANVTESDISQPNATKLSALPQQARRIARPEAECETQPSPHNFGRGLSEGAPFPPFSDGKIPSSRSAIISESPLYEQRRQNYKSTQEPQRRTKTKMNYGCSICRSKMHYTGKCPWAGRDNLRCYGCEFCSPVQPSMLS